jgi:hypothetical protein
MVMQDLEQSIRERAYLLWIFGGCVVSRFPGGGPL